MRTGGSSLIAALAGWTMTFAVPAFGADIEVPTNLGVLEAAVRKAVQRALEDSIEVHFSTVWLSSENTHDANELVEEVLLEELTRRGVHVRRGVSDSIRYEARVSLAGDSVSSAEDSLSPAKWISSAEDSVSTPDDVPMALSYRIQYVGIEYMGHRRKRIWGEKWEDRLARAELALQLVDRSDGRVVAFQEVKGQVQDQFPRRFLDYVESTDYTFALSTLNTQSWTRFLEPIIVSAVVGGLVYLFYSSR